MSREFSAIFDYHVVCEGKTEVLSGQLHIYFLRSVSFSGLMSWGKGNIKQIGLQWKDAGFANFLVGVIFEPRIVTFPISQCNSYFIF